MTPQQIAQVLEACAWGDRRFQIKTGAGFTLVGSVVLDAITGLVSVGGPRSRIAYIGANDVESMEPL